MNQKGNFIPDEKVDEIKQKSERGRKGVKMKDIVYYRQKKLSCMEIGRILGCSKQSISKRLKDWEKEQVVRQNTQRIPDVKDIKDKGLLVKDKVKTPAVPPTPPTPAVPPTPAIPKNPGFIFIRR